MHICIKYRFIDLYLYIDILDIFKYIKKGHRNIIEHNIEICGVYKQTRCSQIRKKNKSINRDCDVTSVWCVIDVGSCADILVNFRDRITTP